MVGNRVQCTRCGLSFLVGAPVTRAKGSTPPSLPGGSSPAGSTAARGATAGPADMLREVPAADPVGGLGSLNSPAPGLGAGLAGPRRARRLSSADQAMLVGGMVLAVLGAGGLILLDLAGWTNRVVLILAPVLAAAGAGLVLGGLRNRILVAIPIAGVAVGLVVVGYVLRPEGVDVLLRDRTGEAVAGAGGAVAAGQESPTRPAAAVESEAKKVANKLVQQTAQLLGVLESIHDEASLQAQRARVMELMAEMGATIKAGEALAAKGQALPMEEMRAMQSSLEANLARFVAVGFRIRGIPGGTELLLELAEVFEQQRGFKLAGPGGTRGPDISPELLAKLDSIRAPAVDWSTPPEGEKRPQAAVPGPGTESAPAVDWSTPPPSENRPQAAVPGPGTEPSPPSGSAPTFDPGPTPQPSPFPRPSPRFGRGGPTIPGPMMPGPRAPRSRAMEPIAPAVSPRPAVGRLSELVGGSGGVPFLVASRGDPLTGIRCSLGIWNGKGVLDSVEPIFGPGGQQTSLPTAVAREGYAVGGLNIDADEYVVAVQAVFFRLRPNGRLDPGDRYTSQWLGTPSGRPPRTVGLKGDKVLGIHGRRGAIIDAIGLVLQ